MELITDKKIQKLYNKFIEEYSKYYDEFELNYIKTHFFEYILKTPIPDILTQIYTEFKILNSNNIYYYEHLKNIKSFFGINNNILEVGGGYLPAFSNIIAREQLKIKQGTITVYDPRLLTNKSKYNNMKLYKDVFDINVNVSDYQTIIGVLTCDATEKIIESACNNNKDFYVAMCGCSHFNFDDDYYGLLPDSLTYQEYIIDKTYNLLKNNETKKLDIIYLDDKFNLPYPILYTKNKN